MGILRSLIHFHAVIGILVSATVDQCGKTEIGTEPCAYEAIAKDFSGLDGCDMLLVLDNGKKLLPANLEEFALPVKDGDALRIDFQEEKEMMSVCMAEDAIVKLTCLAQKSKEGWITDCPKMIDPYAVAWSEKVMKELDPRKVEELYLDGQRAYRYSGKTEFRIYGCTGEHLCTSAYDIQGACNDLLKKASDVRIIYVVNE